MENMLLVYMMGDARQRNEATSAGKWHTDCRTIPYKVINLSNNLS